MIFHMRWNFLTTMLRIPSELNGFISQLFSALGKVRSMREQRLTESFRHVSGRGGGGGAYGFVTPRGVGLGGIAPIHQQYV